MDDHPRTDRSSIVDPERIAAARRRRTNTRQREEARLTIDTEGRAMIVSIAARTGLTPAKVIAAALMGALDIIPAINEAERRALTERFGDGR